MPSLIRVFSHAVKGSLRLQNRSNLRFTEKSRCELCVKAEKRNFGDFEALDRLKISALLERSRKRFFSYFGFLLVFRFHQKWNIARFRVSLNAKKEMSTVRAKMRDIGGLRQDRDSEAIVIRFLPYPHAKACLPLPYREWKKGQGLRSNLRSPCAFWNDPP